jgi:hypothetical protein
MYRILLFIGLLSIIGCSKADRAAFNAIGSKHRITLYSGGIAARTWVSSGKIENEDRSDGYYFQDDATKKLIRVSGDIVIEQE